MSGRTVKAPIASCRPIMTRKNTVIETRGASVPRSKLKFIGESFCSQYQSQAKFYIDEAHTSGLRHLVVVYENGDADFLAGIPDEWADENVQDFIFWPMKNPNSPYP